MSEMTITEALSEINLIKKKLEHKKKSVMNLLVRADHMKDPYEDQGGTPAFLLREVQALCDLEDYFIRIRSGISQANLSNLITIGGLSKTIHDWLTWKREISKEQVSFVNTIVHQVKETLDISGKKPQVYADAEGKTHLVHYKVNLDYPAWVKKQEHLAEIFEKLDGQLSLKNATIVIKV